MWDRIARFLFEQEGRAKGADGKHDDEELAIACAALMVEAAQLDGDFDAEERARLSASLTAHFALGEDDAARLIAEAERRHEDAVDLHRYLKVIGPRFDHEERVRLIEMLWGVVYADGELHAYEAQLLRRVAGLLGVEDAESGAARKRILETMSITPER